VLLITATGSCFGEFNNREWLMLLIVHGFTRSSIDSRDKLQHETLKTFETGESRAAIAASATKAASKSQ
jgi:hypothetical protein